jgi:hypothetical protein
MTLPTYPAEDLNRGTDLLVQLGSFWSQVFEDREELRTHLRSDAHEQAQTHLNFLEAVACVSRFDVPVFHVENWHLVVVKRSDADRVAAVYAPGDLVHGEQDGSVAGRPAGFVYPYGSRDRLDQVRIPLPEGLDELPYQLQNQVLHPGRVLTRGADYDIDSVRRLLRFREDPFEDTRLPKREIFDSAGNKTDEEVALWAYKGQFDLDYIHIQFGYALGLKLKSSQGYKDLLNAFWDSHVLGHSDRDLRAFLLALVNAPAALDPEETVEVVQDEEESTLVVTSSRVYRVPLDANILVSVGDVIHAGDPITDAVEVRELSGDSPDYSILPALSLSESLLGGQFLGELSVRNERAPLEYVGLDYRGKAEVRFEVSGFPGDVERFWELVHERGVAQGQTLANYLDERENPETEPIAINLPVEINPLEFLLDNVLKDNLFVIKLRQASFGDKALSLELFRLLRDCVPPHTAYVAYLELAPAAEVVDLGQAGGEDEAGYEESAGGFHAGVAEDDDLNEASVSVPGAPSYGDAMVTAHYVSLTCQ